MLTTHSVALYCSHRVDEAAGFSHNLDTKQGAYKRLLYEAIPIKESATTTTAGCCKLLGN